MSLWNELTAQTPPIFVAEVDSVQDDGMKVNIRYQGTVINGVWAGSGYPDRKEDDKVLVATLESGWSVIGRTAAPVPPPVEIPEIPERDHLSYSQNAPTGDGWKQAANVWVRPRPDGGFDIHAQTGTGETAPTPPPKSVAPDPIKNLHPTDTGGWRSVGGPVRLEGKTPRQAKYASSFGPWMGMWAYPQLKDMIAGKDIKNFTLSLARTTDSNGIYGRTPVRLFLSNATKPHTSPPAKSHSWSPGKLGRGDRGTWTIPKSWISALQSGEARSIVCYSNVDSESIIFSTDARINVTFNPQ